MSTDANAGARGKTVHVFVSYAREDVRWLDPAYRFSLIPYLMESLRRYDVVFWFDKNLRPGDEYKQHIQTEIEQAQIALLIVSQNFLNSEFIELKEMPRIAERAQLGKMIVVPVLVEPCDWTDYPFLADRQMVPSSPLIDYTESDPKWAKVKYQILDGLKAQLKRIREAPQHAAVEVAKPVEPERVAPTAPAQPVAETKPQLPLRPPAPPSETHSQPAVQVPRVFVPPPAEPAPEPAKTVPVAAVREPIRNTPIADKAAAANASVAAMARSPFGRRTLISLLILNLVSWVDRTVVLGERIPVIYNFDLSFQQLAVLTTAPLLSYVIGALLIGWLGDRFRRKPLIVLAVLLFSVATLATGFASSAQMFLRCQALMMVGSAAFDIFALATLCDFYSERERCFVFSIFCMAIPVGSALGPIIGSQFATYSDWQPPFIYSAIPGLVFAALYGWLGREPQRGSCDRVEPTGNRTTIHGLFENRAFLTAALGLAAFSSGMIAISAAMPMLHFPGPIVLASNGLGGVAGIVLGGWLGQRWLRTSDGALYRFSFWSALLVLPFLVLMLLSDSAWVFPWLFATEFFLFLPTAPLHAAAVNSISSPVRATAISIYLAFVRFFSGFLMLMLFSTVTVHFGYRAALGAVFLILVISGIMLFFGARSAPKLGEAS